MRAENSPDRLRSLIDIGGMNAGVRRESRDGSGIVDIATAASDTMAWSPCVI
jgi:hypothetical protein